jgi:hypothetical protein
MVNLRGTSDWDARESSHDGVEANPRPLIKLGTNSSPIEGRPAAVAGRPSTFVSARSQLDDAVLIGRFIPGPNNPHGPLRAFSVRGEPFAGGQAFPKMRPRADPSK